MKKNPLFSRTPSGFTLVELMVVIVIIATLAAVGFMMGPKMKQRSAAAKSMQNMRQIGPLMMAYATEHSFKLPGMRPRFKDSSGALVDGLHWHQALASQLFPEAEKTDLESDQWWEENQPLLRNPLYSKKLLPLKLAAWHQGYAMNRQIMQNLGFNGSWDSETGPNAKDIPLASIPDQARTPLVAPRVDDWHYAAADLGAKNNAGFIIDDKLPILFVDGHIEEMRPSEYVTRDYDNVPKPK
jgi:prepilin-type N-terminal cleavage/methylation domain-containing protein